MLFLPILPDSRSLLENGSAPVPVKIVHSYDHPGWQVGSHCHPDHAELLYIAGGHEVYVVDNTPFHVAEGDLLLFNSGVFHSLESAWNEPLDVWACGIKDFCFIGLPQNALLTPGAFPVFHTGADSAFLYGLFREMLHQQENKQPGSYALCCSLASALLLWCRQLAARCEQQAAEDKKYFVPEILRYLDSHYA